MSALDRARCVQRGARACARARRAGAAYTAVSTDTAHASSPGALFVALDGRAVRRARLPRRGAATRGATAAVVRRGTAPVPGLELLRGGRHARGLRRLARARRRRDRAARWWRSPAPTARPAPRRWCAAVLAHPVPGARDAGQRQQPGRRAAHHPRGAGGHRGAGGRGRRQRAGRDRPRYREIIEPTDRGHDQRRGRRTSRDSARWTACWRRSSRCSTASPLAVVGTEPPALADGRAARGRRVITAGLARADRVPAVGARCDCTGRATLVGGRAGASPCRCSGSTRPPTRCWPGPWSQAARARPGRGRASALRALRDSRAAGAS